MKGSSISQKKKVKLKVGGVTRTINAKSASDGASAVGSSSTRSSRFPDPQQKLIEVLPIQNLSGLFCIMFWQPYP